MKKIHEKFFDKSEQIYDFVEEFLVECPKCKSFAKVLLQDTNLISDYPLFSPRKLTCLSCGLTKIWKGKGMIGVQMSPHKRQIPQRFLVIGGNFDWYFQEPLWLQTECCGETLWAYNEKHLEFIENYVAAKLRARIPNQNRSLASRLPKWIKSAKNRDEILKAIGKLKEKLNGKS
jgi:hypothetical protein